MRRRTKEPDVYYVMPVCFWPSIPPTTTTQLEIEFWRRRWQRRTTDGPSFLGGERRQFLLDIAATASVVRKRERNAEKLMHGPATRRTGNNVTPQRLLPRVQRRRRRQCCLLLSSTVGDLTRHNWLESSSWTAAYAIQSPSSHRRLTTPIYCSLKPRGWPPPPHLHPNALFLHS